MVLTVRTIFSTASWSRLSSLFSKVRSEVGRWWGREGFGETEKKGPRFVARKGFGGVVAIVMRC